MAKQEREVKPAEVINAWKRATAGCDASAGDAEKFANLCKIFGFPANRPPENDSTIDEYLSRRKKELGQIRTKLILEGSSAKDQLGQVGDVSDLMDWLDKNAQTFKSCRATLLNNKPIFNAEVDFSPNMGGAARESDQHSALTNCNPLYKAIKEYAEKVPSDEKTESGKKIYEQLKTNYHKAKRFIDVELEGGADSGKKFELLSILGMAKSAGVYANAAELPKVGREGWKTYFKLLGKFLDDQKHVICNEAGADEKTILEKIRTGRQTTREAELGERLKEVNSVQEMYAELSIFAQHGALTITDLKGEGAGQAEEERVRESFVKAFDTERQMREQGPIASRLSWLFRNHKAIAALGLTGATAVAAGGGALCAQLLSSPAIQRTEAINHYMNGGFSVVALGATVFLAGLSMGLAGTRIIKRYQAEYHDYITAAKNAIGDSPVLRASFRKLIEELGKAVDPAFEKALPEQHRRCCMTDRLKRIVEAIDEEYAKDGPALQSSQAAAKKRTDFRKEKNIPEGDTLRLAEELRAFYGTGSGDAKALQKHGEAIADAYDEFALERLRKREQSFKKLKENIDDLPHLHVTDFRFFDAGARSDFGLKIRSFVKSYRRLALAEQQEGNYTPDQLDGFHRTIIAELQDIDIRESEAQKMATSRGQPLADELYQMNYFRYRLAYNAMYAGGVLITGAGLASTVFRPLLQFAGKAIGL